MKKRFNKDAFLLATFILFSLSLCALFAMTLPGVELSYKNASDSNIKIDGLFAVFGGEPEIRGVVYHFRFNIISLLSYLFPIIGSIIGIFAFKKVNKISYFISGIFCFLGGILIFMEPLFFIYVNHFQFTFNASLLFGPIIGAIFAMISGFIGIGCGIKIDK